MACPAEVTAVEGAQRYWRHFLDTAPLGMLKPVDTSLLGRLCIELAVGDKAMRELQTNGFVITTSTGTLVQSPWMGMFHRSTEISRKLASELGLPVTARARLQGPEVPPPPRPDGDDDDRPPRGDDLDRFLDQHPDRTLN